MLPEFLLQRELLMEMPEQKLPEPNIDARKRVFEQLSSIGVSLHTFD
jgi:hypothetical protein